MSQTSAKAHVQRASIEPKQGLRSLLRHVDVIADVFNKQTVLKHYRLTTTTTLERPATKICLQHPSCNHLPKSTNVHLFVRKRLLWERLVLFELGAAQHFS